MVKRGMAMISKPFILFALTTNGIATAKTAIVIVNIAAKALPP